MMRAWGLLVSAMVLLSCASSVEPFGGVSVVVDTNLSAGEDFDELRFVAPERDGAAPLVFHFSPRDGTAGGSPKFPMTLTMRNAANSLRERVLSVALWKNGAPVVARDVAFVIPTEGVREVPVLLDTLCALSATGPSGVYVVDGVAHSCDAGRTCVGGSCVPLHVTTLDPSGESATTCRSTRACLATTANVAFSPQKVFAESEGGCSIDVGALRGEEPALVAIEVPATSQLAACTRDSCIVPLPPVRGTLGDSGWRVDNGRMYLPRAVCERALPLIVKPPGDPQCPGTMRSSRECGDTPSSNGVVPIARFERSPDATLCRTLSTTSSLCDRHRTACGLLEAADSICDNRLRSIDCGPCTGSTDAMARIPGGAFAIGASKELLQEAIVRPTSGPRVWSCPVQYEQIGSET